MTHFLTAQEILLTPANLTVHHLEEVLAKGLGHSIDASDVYLQYSQSESWMLEDGIVKEGNFQVDRGFGLRVLSGEKMGFAYADTIALEALQQAVGSARSIVQRGQQGQTALGQYQVMPALYDVHNPIDTLTATDKVSLLRKIDAMTRKKDPRVVQVIVSLSSEYDVVMMLNSQGVLQADIRPLVHLSLRVVVEEKGRREVGAAGGGARTTYAYFSETQLEEYIEKAVRQAILNLTAQAAPAGMMSVVLGPGWPAVLLHEAIGHGLEGDFNRKGSSAFSNRLGEKVATDLCTIVDDGTLPLRRGSLNVDDEGTATQCTVLIEQGILKNYMQDTHNARLMGMQPTGNGRRESYASPPMPRMTNTYLLPGKDDPKEILASLKRGIYAVDFSGGQVDITSGKFVFSMSEAYWVENGKIQYPVRGATLVGSGPEVLHQVSMLGNDLQLDSGIGHCGKEGQTVPVGVGQPTLKIDQMTVGGTA